MKHRFINNGLGPIPMGGAAEYTCTCGRRGPYTIVERHISEMQEIGEEDTQNGDDFGGGDTKANYLPMTPRAPANPTPEPSFTETPTPPELPPPPATLASTFCLFCSKGAKLADLPEVAAWSCGHWIRKKPAAIAESFQDMLRLAFAAGVKAAASGETFETWYQSEVLT